jgi:hypothetical protein
MCHVDLHRNAFALSSALVLTSLLALSSVASAQPDPGFDEITHRVSQQSHDVSCQQMDAWIAAHPSDPNAGRGLIWMAELRLADHQFDLAYVLFDRAAREYPDTEWARHGQKNRADLDLYWHHFSAAIAAYDQLSKLPSPYWQYVGRMSLIQARSERVRFIIYAALVSGLVLLAAFRLGRARKQLWPPPEEVVYAAPVLMLMMLASLAQPSEEAHAVMTVTIGALLLLWANGAYWRAQPPKARWRWPFEALLGLVQAGSLLYCAVIANGLWLKFAETVTNGAER